MVSTQKHKEKQSACSTSPSAVTRLTVYRRPQVMRTGRDSPRWFLWNENMLLCCCGLQRDRPENGAMNVEHQMSYMAGRTCFREQCYTGMRGYYSAGKIAGPDPRKLYMKNMTVFHLYLGMHQFVWARVFCGTGIGYPAAVDCSGSTQKIHIRKIR